MAKKNELPKTEGDLKPKSPGISQKIAGLSNKAFNIIKFILGICLLPFVYSSSVNFLNEFGLIEKSFQNYFWSGVITFLVIYLFIWEPEIIYAKGQKLLEITFTFFKPMLKVAPFLLPIYTIVLFILYKLLSGLIKSDWLARYAIFAIGFTLILHLVFSAKAIHSKKDDFLKANYIFSFSFIYIVNIVLLALCLNFMSKDFSFINFFNSSCQAAGNMLYVVFKQFFLR